MSRFMRIALASCFCVMFLAAVPAAAQAGGGGFGEIDKIDLDGARIGFVATGGLAGIKATLLIYDDGTVLYRWEVRDGNGWTAKDVLPAGEIRALKALFFASDFASMPDEYLPDDVIMDGVDLFVAAELKKGTVKVVRSSTGAVEDRLFSALRGALEKIVMDVRSKPVLEVTCYPDPADPSERVFTMLADGRFSYVQRIDLLPIAWTEGHLNVRMREKVMDLLARFDFRGSRMTVGDHYAGMEFDFIVRSAAGVEAVHFSHACPDPKLDPLKNLADMLLEEMRRLDR